MLNKKTIIFILIFVFLVLAGLSVFLLKPKIFPSPPPRLIGVSPSPGAVNISRLPEIIITFDRKTSPKQITLSSIPSFAHQLLTPGESTTIKYLPQNLLQKTTTYQITLKFKFGGEYSWGFTTTEGEAGAVPGWAEGFKKTEEEYRQKYPLNEVDILNNLIQKVTSGDNKIYSGGGFGIEYSFRAEVFTVHLCEEPWEQTRKKVEDWFNQQGLNKVVVMEKPKIEWLYGCEPPKIIPKVLPTP